MRVLFPVLLILLVAFSGCSSEGDDGDVMAQTDTPTQTETAGPEPVENTPPSASISASIEQGQIPFDVNFTLDGADADGDNLTWSFDADGDGLTEASDADGDLPYAYTHTYESEGVHNVTLTVHDGADETIETMRINATAAAAAPKELTRQEVSADWQAGVMVVGCFGDSFGVGYPEELGGITYASFEVDPATWNQGYHVEITSDTAQDSPGFAFLDADRETLYSDFLSNAADGRVPSNAAYGIFWTCLGGVMHGTYVTG